MISPYALLIPALLLTGALVGGIYFVNPRALPSTLRERSLACAATFVWLLSALLANRASTTVAFGSIALALTLSLTSLKLGAQRAGEPPFVAAIRGRVQQRQSRDNS